MSSIQSDNKVNASTALVVANRPEIGKNNKFKRLPVILQHNIGTYLHFEDLPKVSLVDRLCRAHMSSSLVWAAAAQRLHIPCENPDKARACIFSSYSKLSKNMIRIFINAREEVEDWRKKYGYSIYEGLSKEYDPVVLKPMLENRLKSFSPGIIKEIHQEILWQSGPSEIDMHLTYFRLGFFEKVLSLLPGVPEYNEYIRDALQKIDTHIYYELPLPQMRELCELTLKPLFFSHYNQFKNSSAYAESLKLIEQTIEHCFAEKQYDVSETILKWVIPKNTLLGSIDAIYLNGLSREEAIEFQLILKHSTKEVRDALLERIEQWQAYPRLLSNALSLTRDLNNGKASTNVSHALEKVKKLDWARQDISAMSKNQIYAPQTVVNRGIFRDTKVVEELIKKAAGLDSNNRVPNVDVFERLLTNHLFLYLNQESEKPRVPFLTDLLNENALLIHTHSDRLRMHQTLLKEGAEFSLKTLRNAIKWTHLFKPDFQDPVWESVLKNASEKEKRDLVENFVKEAKYVKEIAHSAEQLVEAEKQYSIDYQGQYAPEMDQVQILKDNYDSLIETFRKAFSIPPNVVKEMEERAVNPYTIFSCMARLIEATNETFVLRKPNTDVMSMQRVRLALDWAILHGHTFILKCFLSSINRFPNKFYLRELKEACAQYSHRTKEIAVILNWTDLEIRDLPDSVVDFIAGREINQRFFESNLVESFMNLTHFHRKAEKQISARLDYYEKTLTAFLNQEIESHKKDADAVKVLNHTAVDLKDLFRSKHAENLKITETPKEKIVSLSINNVPVLTLFLEWALNAVRQNGFIEDIREKLKMRNPGLFKLLVAKYKSHLTLPLNSFLRKALFDMSCVQTLIDQGMRPNLQNLKGAVLHSAFFEQSESLKLLLKHSQEADRKELAIWIDKADIKEMNAFFEEIFSKLRGYFYIDEKKKLQEMREAFKTIRTVLANPK